MYTSETSSFTNLAKKMLGNKAVKKVAYPLVATVGLLGLAGCDQNDARMVSQNISTAADNFEINRRIVFYNGITDSYMLVVEGRCSIEVDAAKNKLDVTCQTGEKEYKKHFLGISDNVTFFAEQIDAANVSPYHYKVIFKPQAIIPDVDFRGDAKELKKALTPTAQPR